VSSRQGHLGSPDDGIRRVLLVEDDPDVRRIRQANFANHGFSVVEAADAREGIDQVEAHHPDLVVLDLMLPVKDGWWFLREVQQCPSPRPVVFVLSAKSNHPERLMARTLGAVAYMEKPFDPEEVVSRIQALIGPAREDQALG
jgi:DNA-binding response OmpR family regulator